MNPYPLDGETCLKPIGALTQAIESMSMRDYVAFMVALSKQQAKEEHEAIARINSNSQLIEDNEEQ